MSGSVDDDISEGRGPERAAESDESVISDAVRELLGRAPEWIRHDLASKDPHARARAEDTLAAMIGAALAERRKNVDVPA